jgi:hypothetical protein
MADETGARLIFEIRGDASQLPADFSKASGAISAEAAKLTAEFQKSTAYTADLKSATDVLIAESQKAIANVAQTTLGAEQAVARTSTSLQIAEKEASSFRNQIGAAVPQLAALGVGLGAVVFGVYELVKSQTEEILQMKRLSTETGLTIETVSALESAFKRTGAEAGLSSQSLALFDKNLSKAHDSTDSASKLIRQMSLNLNDNEKALRQAFVWLNQYADGGNKVADAQALFGRNGRVMLDIIKETNGNLDEAIKKYSELGGVLSEQDAKAAKRFNESMQDALTSVNAAARSIAEDLMPTLGALAKILQVIAPLMRGIFPSGGAASEGLRQALAETGALTDMGSGMLQGNFRPQAPNLPKGGSGGADKARQEAERKLREQLKGIEDRYKEHTDKLQREYKIQEINLADFTQKSIEEETDRYNKTIDVLEKQQALAKPGSSAYDKYTREIQKAEGDYLKAVQKIRDDANATEIESLRKQFDELEKITEERDKARIDAIRGRIATEIAYEVKGLQEVAQIEADAYQRHIDALIEQQNQLIVRAAGKDGGRIRGIINQLSGTTLSATDREKYGLEVAAATAKANQEELEQLNKQIDLLQAAKKTADTASEREIAAAEQRRLELREKADAAIRALDMREAQNKRDLDRQMYEFTLNSPYSSLGARRAAIAKLTELDLEEFDIRHRHNLKVLDDEEAEAQKEIKGFEDKEKRKQEIHERYQTLRDQEDERHNNERNQRQQTGDQDIRSSTFPRGLSPFGDAGMQEFIKSGDILKSTFADIKQSGLDAFGALAEGFGQMVGAWASGADLGDHAIRKLIGSVLAGLAAQAATQALMFTAYGLAALTPWGAAIYGPAAPWFEAAALMGAVALTAAVAGRAISPQQRTNTATGATSSTPSGGSTSPQPVVAGRTTANETVKHIVEVHVKTNDSHIVETFVRDFGLNGRTRTVIKNDGMVAA